MLLVGDRSFFFFFFFHRLETVHLWGTPWSIVTKAEHGKCYLNEVIVVCIQSGLLLFLNSSRKICTHRNKHSEDCIWHLTVIGVKKLSSSNSLILEKNLSSPIPHKLAMANCETWTKFNAFIILWAIKTVLSDTSINKV